MARINVADLDKLAAHKYRWARVLEVHSDWDTVDIELLNAQGQPTGEQWQDVPLFYHCSPDAPLRPNGALEGAAAAFEANCEVIVELDGFQEVKRVVARRDGLKACGEAIFPVVATQLVEILQSQSQPWRAKVTIPVIWVGGTGVPNSGEAVEYLHIKLWGTESVQQFLVNGVDIGGIEWTYADHFSLTGTPEELEIIQEYSSQVSTRIEITVYGRCRGQDYQYTTVPVHCRYVRTDWSTTPYARLYETEILCPIPHCAVGVSTQSREDGHFYLQLNIADDYDHQITENQRRTHQWGVVELVDSGGCQEGCKDFLHSYSVDENCVQHYNGCYERPIESHLREAVSWPGDGYVVLETQYGEAIWQNGIPWCPEYPEQWWDFNQNAPCEATFYTVDYDKWPYQGAPIVPDDFVADFAPVDNGPTSIGYWLAYFGLEVPQVTCDLSFADVPAELLTGP